MAAAAPKRGLGKGLGALITSAPEASGPTASVPTPIGLVMPMPVMTTSGGGEIMIANG